MDEHSFTNAKIIMADEILRGTLVVRDGIIYDIASGNSASPSAININQDYLMPGLVELHTDTLEHHMTPRPNTAWPAIARLSPTTTKLPALVSPPSLTRYPLVMLRKAVTVSIACKI